MIGINILLFIILFFSFIGGLKEGAVKNFFSLIALIIAIPIAGFYYHLIAALFSFLPGTNLGNFVGFFITLALIAVILQLIFILPRKIIQKAWRKGIFFRLLGGALNIINVSIGMVVFTLVVGAYPIFGWLERAVENSGVLAWLVGYLSFVQAMLPGVFQDAGTLVIAGSVI